MRNEAILGLGRLAAGSCGGPGVDSFFGLQPLEQPEGVVVMALGHIDAPLKAGEFVTLLGVGLREGDVEDVGGVLPELGLDGAETAEELLTIDEGIDEHALLGGGGTEAAVIFGDELFECRGVFAADELRLGVDAGFECVHGGAGLALDGAGSGGFLRVETIGCELFFGCHKTGG